MIKTPELSIFFPFWNEEKNIENVVRRAAAVSDAVAKKWEIIMVDDGSSDNTLKLAENLAKEDSRLRVVTHQPNRGYGAALKEGFKHAKYNIIVFNDGDGQFDFSEVNKFLDKIDTFDMVIGIRKKRRDHPIRHLWMNLLKVWDFILFGFYFRDIDCGFKMFKRSAVDKILPLYSEGAMITTEILAKSIRAKLKIGQANVSHYPRMHGNESGGNFRVIFRAIKESFRLRKEFISGRT